MENDGKIDKRVGWNNQVGGKDQKWVERKIENSLNLFIIIVRNHFLLYKSPKIGRICKEVMTIT